MGYETVKRIAVIIGIILTILILNAFSLCFTEMMEIEDQHPLYNFFQSFESQEKYTQFWVIYWGISFFLSFFLIVLTSTKFLDKWFKPIEKETNHKTGIEQISWDTEELNKYRVTLQKHYDSISNSQAVRLLGLIAALFTFIQITQNAAFVISINMLFESCIYLLVIFILIFFSFRAFFRFALYSNYASQVLWVKEKDLTYFLEDFPHWREHNTMAILDSATFLKIAGLLRCAENKKYETLKIYHLFPYVWFGNSAVPSKQKWGYGVCFLLTITAVCMLSSFLA